jgi:hypothetical protein
MKEDVEDVGKGGKVEKEGDILEGNGNAVEGDVVKDGGGVLKRRDGDAVEKALEEDVLQLGDVGVVEKIVAKDVEIAVEKNTTADSFKGKVAEDDVGELERIKNVYDVEKKGDIVPFSYSDKKTVFESARHFFRELCNISGIGYKMKGDLVQTARAVRLTNHGTYYAEMLETVRASKEEIASSYAVEELIRK